MKVWLLALLWAGGVEAGGIKALVLTCDPALLPLPWEAYIFQAPGEELGGVLMGDMEEVFTLVRPEWDRGGDFVPYRENLLCANVRKPRYLATIWSPGKTKVWCAVYDGDFVRVRDCIEGCLQEDRAERKRRGL